MEGRRGGRGWILPRGLRGGRWWSRLCLLGECVRGLEVFLATKLLHQSRSWGWRRLHRLEGARRRWHQFEIPYVLFSEYYFYFSLDKLKRPPDVVFSFVCLFCLQAKSCFLTQLFQLKLFVTKVPFSLFKYVFTIFFIGYMLCVEIKTLRYKWISCLEHKTVVRRIIVDG